MGMTATELTVAERHETVHNRPDSSPLDPFFDLSDDLMGLADMGSGRWIRTNAAFERHLGYAKAELDGVRVSSLVHPEDLALCEHAARALAAGGRFEFQSRMRRKSGEYRLISWTLDPSPERFAVYCVGHTMDPCTRRTMASEEVTDRISSTTKSLEAARAFTFTWLRSQDGLVLDAAAFAVLGCPAHALMTGRSYLDLVEPRDQERLRSKIAAASRSSPQFHVDYRIKKSDGSIVWIEETGRVVFSPDGRKSGIVGLCRDVTSKKLTEASAELVMNEMTHRAKNILTVVQAVLQFTKADTVEAYAAAIRQRVQALARVQGLLTTERWSGIDLLSVIAAEFEPFGGIDGTRLSADGPPVRIAAHALQTLTLVIHELATNAAKYGALSVPQGRISLTWTVDASGLAITWKEENGPAARPPARKGFGHTLLSASLSHIEGSSRLDFRPEGLVCELGIPEAALMRSRTR